MDVNKIFKNSRRKKEDESTHRVPRLSIPSDYKRYLGTLEMIANKTNDFESTVKQLCSSPELQQYFKDIYFGNLQDPFRVINFWETSFNSIKFTLETLIEEECRLRSDYAETKRAYFELTSVSPNAEQKANLKKFEQVITDTILGNARTNAEEKILSGHKSETNILKSEQTVHEPKTQKLQDKKEFGEIRIKHYPIINEDTIKNSCQNRISENPELAKSFQNEMKRNLAPFKIKPNGNGSLKKFRKNRKAKPEPSPLSKVSLNATKDEIE